jgi:hypothetical protein
MILGLLGESEKFLFSGNNIIIFPLKMNFSEFLHQSSQAPYSVESTSQESPCPVTYFLLPFSIICLALYSSSILPSLQVLIRRPRKSKTVVL